MSLVERKQKGGLIMRVKDNWEYVQDFCNDFGRLPKDADELEYFLSYVDEKRQKAGRDTTKMMETPVSDDLEEAAEEESLWAFSEPTAQGYAKRLFFKSGFKRGVKWDREQMMKEAVEGKIYGGIKDQEDEPYEIWVESYSLPKDKFHLHENVKLVIIKGD